MTANPSAGWAIIARMRRLLAVVVLVLLTGSTVPAAPAAPGPLIVVGGGGTTPAIVAKALALAGGREARVAVLPQASELAETGPDSAKMWMEAGAKEARPVAFEDRAAARAIIGGATLIWMPGGDQNKFMKAIVGTGLDDLIRERHRSGVAVGGTSAGAAILSEAMMTGEADLKSLTTGSTELAKGLGLWPQVIVDQHFLKRQRGNRLLSAVLDHPDARGCRHRRADRGHRPRRDVRGGRRQRSGRGGPASGHAGAGDCRASRWPPPICACPCCARG